MPAPLFLHGKYERWPMLRVSARMHDRINAAARASGRSMSQVIASLAGGLRPIALAPREPKVTAESVPTPDLVDIG